MSAAECDSDESIEPVCINVDVIRCTAVRISQYRTPSAARTISTALPLIYIPQMQLNRFSYSKTESQLTIPDIKTVNSALPCPLSSVCSPWDQSGWRCERGRCRCSRSRQREELHRLSRASRARPTHGAQMHVASAGAAAVAVPGRSRTTSQLAAWLTLVHTGEHSLSWCVSASRLQLVSHALDIFFACAPSAAAFITV